MRFKRSLKPICPPTGAIIPLYVSPRSRGVWKSLKEHMETWKSLTLTGFSNYIEALYYENLATWGWSDTLQCRQRVNGCDNLTSLRQAARVCVNDMFWILLPLEGSFSGRYTFTLTGVLICKRGRDKCTCHSPPHGIPSCRGMENEKRWRHDSGLHSAG